MSGLPEVAALMARLCEIPSVSRDEGRVAEAVRAELTTLGIAFTEDDAAAAIGCGCGNIVGHLPATAPGRPIGFCAHLDTVPQEGPISVVCEDGLLRNAHPTILGGDNKSAVATILVALRRIRDEGIPHAGIDVVFTPCEEIGLRGAAHLDPARLRAEIVVVYDHTEPVGGVIVSAPSLSKVRATFVGQTAHAGLSPEQGRSAIDAAARAIAQMPLGRIDAETTANVGTIAGGTATNVVSERCDLLAEARSRDPQALSRQIDAMVDALCWAATEGEVDVEIEVVPEFTGYRLASDDPALALARQALEATGHTPVLIDSGGGSDVNAFIANGVRAVNLANGMVAPHTPQEEIAVADLEAMVEVTLAIVAGARG